MIASSAAVRSAARGRARALAPALIGAACLFAAMALPAQSPERAAPGASYESLGSLPDWSGWWLASVARTTADELRNEPAPLKPEVAAAIDASRAADVPDPLRHCRPWQFTGSSGRFTEALEFLFTPGRVTLTNERGLIRRIYTDRPMPANPEPTNTGTSIGRWEGDALVVETTGIDPRVPYPGPGPGSVEIGADVVIRERIFLRDENTLQFDIVTVAPDIFAAPDRRTQLYTRLDKTMANEISFCSEFDRSVEPGTGAQRFDMTPPANLPPPPPR